MLKANKGDKFTYVKEKNKIKEFRTRPAAQKFITAEKNGLFSPYIKGWTWKIVKK
jgi:hypothetical protein